MTPHMVKKRNSCIKNVKQAAFIKYKLACKGLCMADIARDLNITRQAAYRAIHGLSKVSRVDEWLCQNLGAEVGNG